jgi:hypothetical protein
MQVGNKKGATMPNDGNNLDNIVTNPQAAGKIIEVRTPNAAVKFEDSEVSSLGRLRKAEAELAEAKLASLRQGVVIRKIDIRD